MKKFLSLGLILLLAAFFIGALAGYSTKVYMEQGGDRLWVTSGGAIEVESGGIQNVTGTLNICSGGALIQGSSAVSYHQLVAGTITPPTNIVYLTVPGIDTNDFAIAQISSPMAATPHINAVSCYTDQIQIIFDGMPTTGMKFNAMVLSH